MYNGIIFDIPADGVKDNDNIFGIEDDIMLDRIKKWGIERRE